ncbi:MAG: DUF1697 domain-containing protein [Solirubrobacterales bacterium]
MDRYVAFLRGMNLGGRRIKNDELRARIEQLGFVEVATFRASGNVIFAVGGDESDDEVALAEAVEVGLSEALGYEVPTFLRSAAEMGEIRSQEPFDASLLAASAGKLQVSILASAPDTAVSEEVLAMASSEDRLSIHGRELYWLPSGGLLDSSLDLKAIDAMLGLSTRRTKGTVDQIATKYFET